MLFKELGNVEFVERKWCGVRSGILFWDICWCGNVVWFVENVGDE